MPTQQAALTKDMVWPEWQVVYSKTQAGSDVCQSLVTERTQIEGGKGVEVYGQKSVNIVSADIKADSGQAKVTSAGDVTLGFNTDTEQHNWTTSSTSGNVLKKKTTTTQHETLDKTAQVTELEGQNVKVLGYNVKSEGAKMDGSQLVQVEGVNNTQLYAVQEVHQYTKNSQTSSSTFGITYSKSSSSDSTIKSEALGTELKSDQAIQVGVGAVTDVQGAILTAPKVDFVRSAGADTSKEGELILAGSTNTTTTSHTEKTTTAGVYQEMSGQGGTTQTLTQTQINGKVNIATGINTTVVIPEGDLKTQVQSLSQQPGLAYIGELAKDPRVNWGQVKLAYDKWDYSQAGLTPAGAALLAIAIAAYTGGMGAELLGGTAATSTSAATLMGSTVYGAAANAGFAALASSAGVSFVNNGGDIGKTLSDMGSKDSVKNVVLAMATAGALQGMSETMTIDGQKLSDINVKNSTFGANLGKAVMNNLANATMTSAITGTPLEDNIKTGLVSAFISAGAGSAAFEIGEKTANDQIAKALAHAIAGCVAGAAGQGSGGCSAGATGAVVGELAAQWYDNPPNSKKPEDVLNFVKVVSAAAGAMTGDGSAASVATASMTGANAALNNYLNHVRPSMLRLSEKERYDAASASCANGDKSACATRDDLAALSQKRDHDLAQACAGSTPDLCKTKTNEASSMGNIVTTIPGSTFTYANSPTPSPLNTATIGSPTRPDSFHDQAAKSTSEAIVLEVGNQAVGALIGVAVKGVGATKVAVSDFFASQGIAASDATTARIANNFGKDGDAFTTAANQMVAAKNAGWTTSEGRVWYPPNNGAVPGTNFETTLPVGAKLDRYGGTTDRSTFLAPAGTQFEQRALPASTDMSIHDQFVVLKPLPVEQSNTMPWFGQQGMGVQFDTSKGVQTPINELVKQGYLKKVTP